MCENRAKVYIFGYREYAKCIIDIGRLLSSISANLLLFHRKTFNALESLFADVVVERARITDL